MATISDMRRRLQDLHQKRKGLIEQIAGADRLPTDEERKQLDGWRAEGDGLKGMLAEYDAASQAVDEASRSVEPMRPEVSAQRETPTTDNPWRSFGEFLQAVQRAQTPGGSVDRRLYQTRATGLGESIPSDGGFLVATDFASELWRRAYELGQITQRCRRVPISANANGIKINGVDESSRATGSRWGGIRGYWLAEAGQITASRPKFSQIELNLKKLGVLAYATDELLQDAAALESIVMQAASEEIVWMTENAIVNGTGAGQPLGLMNAGCTVSASKETGQAAATIVTENIVNMWSRMWSRSRANAVWLIDQSIEPQLYTMFVATGVGGVPVYMPANGLSQSPYASLMGRPVIPVEYGAALGTVGDIMLCDFSQYLLADKAGIQAASSIHVQFIYDESVFRFIYRVDGQPAWNAALTPASGASTLAPFVTLATRA